MALECTGMWISARGGSYFIRGGRPGAARTGAVTPRSARTCPGGASRLVEAPAGCRTAFQYERSAEESGEAAGWDEAPDPPRVGQRQRSRCALEAARSLAALSAGTVSATSAAIHAAIATGDVEDVLFCLIALQSFVRRRRQGSATPRDPTRRNQRYST